MLRNIGRNIYPISPMKFLIACTKYPNLILVDTPYTPLTYPPNSN